MREGVLIAEKPVRPEEEDVLAAIREVDFGTVEVVLHQGKIREIRQVRKKRFEGRSRYSAE